MLLIYDFYTHWKHACPLPTKSAEDTIKTVTFMKGHTRCNILYSDNSRELEVMAKVLSMHHDIRFAGIPATNGQI